MDVFDLNWSIAGIIWYLFLTFTLAVIARKLNRDDYWLAYIPILNIFYVIWIADLGILGVVLMFVPILNFVVWCWAWWNICKKLNKPEILALLSLFPPGTVILTIYLAFFSRNTKELV